MDEYYHVSKFLFVSNVGIFVCENFDSMLNGFSKQTHKMESVWFKMKEFGA